MKPSLVLEGSRSPTDPTAILEFDSSMPQELRRFVAREQYCQAQNMEAVTRLADGIAHHFNNLLTVINGYADLLSHRLPEGDPAREMLRQIAEAGNRAVALTRQLVALSRTGMMPRL